MCLVKKSFYLLFLLLMGCYVHIKSLDSESSGGTTFDTIDINGNQVKANFTKKEIKGNIKYLDYKVDVSSLNHHYLDRAEIKYSSKYLENPNDMFFEQISSKTIRVWISNTNLTKKYDGRYSLEAEVFPYLEEDKLNIDKNSKESSLIRIRNDVQTYKGKLNVFFDVNLIKHQEKLVLNSSEFDDGEKLPIKFTEPNGGITDADVYDFPEITISNIYESESLLLILWAVDDIGEISISKDITDSFLIEKLKGIWIITNEIMSGPKIGTNFITNSLINVITNVYTNLFKKNNFTIPLTESDSSAADISSDYITTVRPYIPVNSEITNVINYFFRVYNVNLKKDLLKQRIEDNIDKSGKIIDKTVFPNKVKTLYNNKLEAIEYYLDEYIVQKSQDLRFFYQKQEENQ